MIWKTIVGTEGRRLLVDFDLAEEVCRKANIYLTQQLTECRELMLKDEVDIGSTMLPVTLSHIPGLFHCHKSTASKEAYCSVEKGKVQRLIARLEKAKWFIATLRCSPPHREPGSNTNLVTRSTFTMLSHASRRNRILDHLFRAHLGEANR